MPRRTNVHYPLDSELLYFVASSLGRLRDWEGIGFVDHRDAKRRVLNIRNRRGKKRLEVTAI